MLLYWIPLGDQVGIACMYVVYQVCKISHPFLGARPAEIDDNCRYIACGPQWTVATVRSMVFSLGFRLTAWSLASG